MAQRRPAKRHQLSQRISLQAWAVVRTLAPARRTSQGRVLDDLILRSVAWLPPSERALVEAALKHAETEESTTPTRRR